MGRKILILEDSVERIETFRKTLCQHDLTIVTEAAQAIDLLKARTKFEVIFLDHDLGGQTFVSASDPNTGSEVMRFMLNDPWLCSEQPCIVIHSMNTPEAINMFDKLSGEYIETHRIGYDVLLAKYLNDPSFLS